MARECLSRIVLASVVALGLAACGTTRTTPTPTETDLAALARVTQDALENNPTGVASNWENPETGHRGSVTPLRTYDEGQTPCRDYQQTFTVESGELTKLAYGKACRGDDGTWNTERHSGFDSPRRRYDDDPYYDYPYGPYYRRYPYYGWPWYHDPFWRSRTRIWLGYGHYF